ncbi:MAG: GTP-binding protein [Candidatus Thermoplasmatota archaeon]|nr:GTP-binding protein [Candidatus Thermoplasmatota archaeon]
MAMASGESGWNVLIKKKVCLLGQGAVGKTSLIRRFVTDQFDDSYITTIGTKVTKKEVLATSPGGTMARVDMTVWDIMGQEGFRELLKQAYFYGAGGVVAVCDVTRRETFDELESWIEDVMGIVEKDVPIVFFGNKSDLPDIQVSQEDLMEIAKAHDTVAYMTSAKTGDGVEEGFLALAKKMIEND